MTIGDLRERISEANEVHPEDVRLIYGDEELTKDDALINEFDGTPIEGREGALEVLFQVVISPQCEAELEEGIARRMSVHTIGDLANRRSLNLSYMKPDTMQDQMAVHENPELGKQYSRAPGSICEFVGLEELIMQRHLLKHLPSRIGSLSRLKVLKVAENKLAKMPATITNLTELREVDMQKNRITMLPSTIGSLVNLKILLLQSNMLEVLPESLSSLVALERLNVSSNRLTNLPESFAQLVSLTGLYINGNRFERLPDQFWTMQLVTFSYDLNLVDVQNREDFVACMPETFHNDACADYLPENKNSFWSCICRSMRNRRQKHIIERRRRSSDRSSRASRGSLMSVGTTASQNELFNAAMSDGMQLQMSTIQSADMTPNTPRSEGTGSSGLGPITVGASSVPVGVAAVGEES